MYHIVVVCVLEYLQVPYRYFVADASTFVKVQTRHPARTYNTQSTKFSTKFSTKCSGRTSRLEPQANSLNRPK